MTTNLLSIGKAAGELNLTLNQIKQRAAKLAIEPAAVLDGRPYYTREDIRNIEQAVTQNQTNGDEMGSINVEQSRALLQQDQLNRAQAETLCRSARVVEALPAAHGCDHGQEYWSKQRLIDWLSTAKRARSGGMGVQTRGLAMLDRVLGREQEQTVQTSYGIESLARDAATGKLRERDIPSKCESMGVMVEDLRPLVAKIEPRVELRRRYQAALLGDGPERQAKTVLVRQLRETCPEWIAERQKPLREERRRLESQRKNLTEANRQIEQLEAQVGRDRNKLQGKQSATKRAPGAAGKAALLQGKIAGMAAALENGAARRERNAAAVREIDEQLQDILGRLARLDALQFQVWPLESEHNDD